MIDFVTPVGGGGVPDNDFVLRALSILPSPHLNPNFMQKEYVDLVNTIKTNVLKTLGNPGPEYELMITSSASESIGVLASWFTGKIYGSRIEHDAVREIVDEFVDEGDSLPNMKHGDALFIMSVNNETGAYTKRSVADLVKYTKSRGAYYVCDISQSWPKTGFDVPNIMPDAVIFSSHKLDNGTPGVGFLLYHKNIKGKKLVPGVSILGDNRGGTPNGLLLAMTHLAIKENFEDRMNKNKKIDDIHDYTVSQVQKRPYLKIIEVGGNKSKHVLMLSCVGKCNGALKAHMEKNNIYISLSSVCKTSGLKPGHVVQAMGVTDPDILRGTHRLGFSSKHTKKDIDTLMSTYDSFVKM